MDTNAEMNLSIWVDDRMACLAPAGDWRPDLAGAMARFNERRHIGDGHARRRPWVLAAAVAACLVVILAIPASRDFVRHLWTSSYLQMVNVGQVSAASVTLKSGQAAPDFTLQSATGDEIQPSAYEGRVVLINFWATWCSECRKEIPWLIEFQKEYGARGFEVLGVSMDDDGWKAVRPFIAEEDVNYPVVIGNDTLAKSYGLTAMPMTFLIDRKGRIAATSVGVVDQSACDREIMRLLAK
jgi:peroxiredoxin